MVAGWGLTWVGVEAAAWPGVLLGPQNSQASGLGFRPPPLTEVGADGVRVLGC